MFRMISLLGGQNCKDSLEKSTVLKEEMYGKCPRNFWGFLNIVSGQGKYLPEDITIRRPELHGSCGKI